MAICLSLITQEQSRFAFQNNMILNPVHNRFNHFDPTCLDRLSNNSRLLCAHILLESQKVQRQPDIVLQIILGIEVEFALILFRVSSAQSYIPSHGSSDQGTLTSSCFSMYRRIVAPDEPVPDNLTTILLPSSNLTYKPWFFVTLPSTGSLYSKSPASVTLRPETSLPTNDFSLIFSVRAAVSFCAPSESTFSKS